MDEKRGSEVFFIFLEAKIILRITAVQGKEGRKYMSTLDDYASATFTSTHQHRKIRIGGPKNHQDHHHHLLCS